MIRSYYEEEGKRCQAEEGLMKRRLLKETSN